MHHFAIWPFLKMFAGNKMVCTFGHLLALLNVEKIATFKGLFWKSLSKTCLLVCYVL